MAGWVKLGSRTLTLSPTTAGQWVEIAKASTFGELKSLLPATEYPKGTKIRIVMNLNQPVAPAFDLAGAELIFGQMMPEGLDLIDVRGEGWNTAIIDGESDPVVLAAIGAWLAAHWVGLSLALIGITVALGLLLLSVSLLVLAVTAPEVIPSTFKWVAAGLGALAAVLALAYGASKRKAPT